MESHGQKTDAGKDGRNGGPRSVVADDENVRGKNGRGQKRTRQSASLQVAELESKRKLVEANQGLITRVQAKIKAKLGEA